MGYDRVRFKALQVAERILEDRPFTPIKEKLVAAFCEGVEWDKQQQPRNQPTELSNKIQHIQRVVVTYFNLECYDIWERTRFEEVVKARRWLWYWCRKKYGLSLFEISRYCGFSHATVSVGIGAIESDLQIYSDVKKDYNELEVLMDSIA